eukprot:758319-Hanusia_phi.AAC.1
MSQEPATPPTRLKGSPLDTRDVIGLSPLEDFNQREVPGPNYYVPPSHPAHSTAAVVPPSSLCVLVLSLYLTRHLSENGEETCGAREAQSNLRASPPGLSRHVMASLLVQFITLRCEFCHSSLLLSSGGVQYLQLLPFSPSPASCSLSPSSLSSIGLASEGRGVRLCKCNLDD